jgi:hypothetical protein
MAVTIISNRPKTSAVFHVTSANATIVVAGNNATSNVASAGETLTGAYITQAAWGCDPNGYIVIKRGSAIAAVYDSTGQQEYAGCGMPINVGSTANITIEFIGSANCYVLFEVQKVGPGLNENSEYFQV